MTKISILHISDLHKDKNDSYDDLISSLELDADNYEKAGIKRPEIIVVSGDIIKGAMGVDAANEIKDQYSQASIFLESLTDLFLDGDKRRLIIVPGNHDINREVSKVSMTIIEHGSNERDLHKHLYDDNSLIRWNWKDLHFYEISNRDTYNSRFDHFIEFFNGFYNGVHELSTIREEQSCIFHLKEYNIAFIGFNSCDGLDHLNTAGKINSTTLTRLRKPLKELHNSGNLLIGVWHHHTNGSPYENNYLDKRILTAMIDRHIYMGLHGHQHISEIANEFKGSINEQSLYLVSAGTLYGNIKDLPPGTSRQYNIIEIDLNDDVNITIHSREDRAPKLFPIPSWTKGRIGSSYESSISFKLPKPPLVDMETLINNILRKAETTDDISSIHKDFIDLGTDNPIVRKFLLEFLVKADEYEKIYSIFLPVLNNEEAVQILNAVINLNDSRRVANALKDKYIHTSSDASVKTLRNAVERIISKIK